MTQLLPSSINKFHGFHSQNSCNDVICVVPSAWDLHQTLFAATNKHQTTLRENRSERIKIAFEDDIDTTENWISTCSYNDIA